MLIKSEKLQRSSTLFGLNLKYLLVDKSSILLVENQGPILNTISTTSTDLVYQARTFVFAEGPQSYLQNQYRLSYMIT